MEIDLLNFYKVIRLRNRPLVFLILISLLFPLNAFSQALNKEPRVILWTWQRKEDLRFINPEATGVAFLAGTIFVKDCSFYLKPRLQPLRVPNNTWLTAVIRIQILRGKHLFTTQLARKMAAKIAGFSRIEGVSAIQIDFEAKKSERAFYRELLDEVRLKVGRSYPLSITALASWCTYDDWLKGLPVSEAVPMFYRMGPERPLFLAALENGGIKPECGQSIGMSLDEAFAIRSKKYRVYAFNPKAWTEDALNKTFPETRK